jgi:hypothetical protein
MVNAVDKHFMICVFSSTNDKENNGISVSNVKHVYDASFEICCARKYGIMKG